MKGERERIIRRAEEAGDFVTGDDGFVIYWSKGLNGALNEWTLRLLADELERRNAPWAAQMAEYFEPPSESRNG